MTTPRLSLRRRAHSAYLRSIQPQDSRRPNIILVMVDDMGHGDLSCFGSSAIRTPHLDQMATEGVRLTHFYSSSPLCSPSRFGCLTGRYPTRGFVRYVFFPTVNDAGRAANRRAFPLGVRGILPDEITFAEALHRSGYRTGIFGKWHLGDTSPHLPNQKGFDHFFGSYYSNDMLPYAFYRNDQVVIEAPANQSTLTRAITSEILGFIEENRQQPFLVYYPSPFPHFPVHSSPDFQGSSAAGAYGDCVQEIDWSVGQIRAKLRELGLERDTLILFTSDNGPWFEGSPGPHRGRKANSFDGGQAVPLVAAWPGVIPAGTTVDIAAMNIDFFPTFLNLAGVPLPEDRQIDGLDMLPVLKGEAARAPHEELLYIGALEVKALRDADNYKYVARDTTENAFFARLHQGPFLFDLARDRSESYDLSAHLPERAERMRVRLEARRKEMAENPRGWKD